jgi:hypothetical protein
MMALLGSKHVAVIKEGVAFRWFTCHFNLQAQISKPKVDISTLTQSLRNPQHLLWTK